MIIFSLDVCGKVAQGCLFYYIYARFMVAASKVETSLSCCNWKVWQLRPTCTTVKCSFMFIFCAHIYPFVLSGVKRALSRTTVGLNIYDRGISVNCHKIIPPPLALSVSLLVTFSRWQSASVSPPHSNTGVRPLPCLACPSGIFWKRGSCTNTLLTDARLLAPGLGFLVPNRIILTCR